MSLRATTMGARRPSCNTYPSQCPRGATSASGRDATPAHAAARDSETIRSERFIGASLRPRPSRDVGSGYIGRAPMYPLSTSDARVRKMVRRRPYHHGNLREALIDAALALVEERGSPEFTLREVARRVGVTHAAPQRHFEDRAALVAAVAEEGFHGLHAHVEQG